MARASTKTLLALDTFAKILGVHPLHFNGVSVQDLAPATTCGQPLMQYAWQSANAVAREDVANAIADAEDRIARWTRFKLAPVFEVDERHAWPRYTMPEVYGPSSLWNVRGQSSSVRTDWGHVIAAGVESLSPIVVGAAVVYTDTDGDGYSETATISAPTTVTDTNEVRVYYPGESGAWEWEIRPIKVVFSGGNVVITARREQLVNPGLLEGFSGRGVDGLDAQSFLAMVDVYRVYHDPSQQVQFLWDGPRWSSCNCRSVTCTTCFVNAQFGCANVRDYRLGALNPSAGVWNAATSTFDTTTLAVNGAPDKIRLWYRAGYRDATQRRPLLEMKPEWARAVTYFAAALLARPMCACQNLEAQMQYWQDDISKIQQNQSTTENYQVDRKLLANPFGTTRGALFAWRTFQRESLGEAVAL